MSERKVASVTRFISFTHHHTTLTVHTTRRAAFRTAVYILWMLVRHPRSTVEFVTGSDA